MPMCVHRDTCQEYQIAKCWKRYANILLSQDTFISFNNLEKYFVEDIKLTNLMLIYVKRHREKVRNEKSCANTSVL